MRIRKHAQKFQTCCLPSQLSAPNNPCPRDSPSTLVCELNRSPWDVISIASEEMREDDSGGEETANAVESILSLNGTIWEDNKHKGSSSFPPPIIASISGKERRHKVEEIRMSFICCNKTDGKGWKCKKEAKRGHSLCEHHLSQLKSYYTTNKSSCFSGRRLKSMYHGKRSSWKNSMMPSSNYYYYTGFGPLWGKGRGEAKSRREIEAELDPGDSFSSSPSLLSSDDDAGSEVEENVEKKKKKRGRKPVKTRSLKSLL